MSCQFKDECPSHSGWCDGLKQDFARCLPFLITAVRNARTESAVLRAQLEWLENNPQALAGHLRDATNTIECLEIDNAKYKRAYDRCHDCPIVCVKDSYISMLNENERLRKLVRPKTESEDEK